MMFFQSGTAAQQLRNSRKSKGRTLPVGWIQRAVGSESGGVQAASKSARFQTARALLTISATTVLATALSATANAGLIHGHSGNSAIHESATIAPGAASLLSSYADSSVASAAHALSGPGSSHISSSLPITGHATSRLAMQGAITTSLAKAVGGGGGGGGTGAGSAGQGSGAGGSGATGVSGVFLSSPAANVNNALVASLAASSMLPASSSAASPLLSPAPISSGNALSANTAFIGSNVFNSNAMTSVSGGLTVADSSLRSPVPQAFVDQNPEPASIIIFAGLFGPLAIGWRRRRNAVVRPRVS